MVYKNSFKPIVENKKPVETVYELKNYEIKKSPLSPTVRSKVVNKSGSNYVSDNKEGYGPCGSSNCPYSSSCRFYLKIGVSGDSLQLAERKGNSDCFIYYNWFTMENIAQARTTLEWFENGKYKVREDGDCFSPLSKDTDVSERKQELIMKWLHYWIRFHEGGGEVYEPRVNFSNVTKGP